MFNFAKLHMFPKKLYFLKKYLENIDLYRGEVFVLNLFKHFVERAILLKIMTFSEIENCMR